MNVPLIATPVRLPRRAEVDAINKLLQGLNAEGTAEKIDAGESVTITFEPDQLLAVFAAIDAFTDLPIYEDLLEQANVPPVPPGGLL